MWDDDLHRLEQSDLSLLETLNHALDRGVVAAGDVTISVAGVPLVYLGLNVLLSSAETIDAVRRRRPCEPRMRPCNPAAVLPEAPAAWSAATEGPGRGAALEPPAPLPPERP